MTALIRTPENLKDWSETIYERAGTNGTAVMMPLFDAADAWNQDRERANIAERERDAALEREGRLRCWIVSVYQPHLDSCDAWGLADPFGDEAMADCSCGLRGALANTPEDSHDDDRE